MSINARTFEEAVEDLLADYSEVPKREQMETLRAAATEIGKQLRGVRDDNPEG